MTQNRFLKVFIYALLMQFFVTNTVLAVGWQGIVGRDWDTDLYDAGLTGKSLRVEVVKIPRIEEDSPSPEDFGGGVSLFVHGIDHGTKSHEFLIEGTVFDFAGGITRHKIKTDYEGGTLEFWVGKDGSVELSHLDTPYLLDFITTGDVTLKETLSREKIRIGARSFLNQGILRSNSLLEIYTTEGNIVNTGVMEAAEILLRTEASVLNNSGRIVGHQVDIHANAIENHLDALMAATRLMTLTGETLTLSQSTLLATQGVFNLTGLHLKDKSILDVLQDFDFKGAWYRSEESSLLRARNIDIEVDYFRNQDQSKLQSDKSIHLGVAEFSNVQGTIESGEDVLITREDLKPISDSAGLRQLGFFSQEMFFNEGGMIAASSKIDIDIKDWDFDTSGGILYAGHDLLLKSWGINNDTGKIIAPTVKLIGHDLQNGRGIIYGDDVSLTLTSEDLSLLEGTSRFGRRIAILSKDRTAGLLANKGLIEATRLLTVRSGGLLFNEGSIGGFRGVDIESGAGICNDLGGKIYAGTKDFALPGAFLKVVSGGRVLNQGYGSSFYSPGEVTVKSHHKDILVQDGARIEGGSIDVNAWDSIRLSQAEIEAEEALSLATDHVGEDGNILIKQGHLISKLGDVKVDSAGAFNSFGKSKIEGNLISLEAMRAVSNIYGSHIEARDLLTVKGETFDNTKGIALGRRVEIKADRKENPHLKGHLSLNRNPYSSSRRKKQSQGNSSTKKTEASKSVSEEEAKADKALHEEKKEESDSPEGSARKKLKESILGHIINPEGRIEGTDEVTIVSLGDVYNSDGGVITSPKGKVTLTTSGRVLNQDASEIQAQDALDLWAKRGVVLNTEGSLIKGRRVSLKAGLDVTNEGKGEDISSIFATEILRIASKKGGLFNKQGDITSQGRLLLLIREVLENEGTVRGAKVHLPNIHRLSNHVGSVLEGLEKLILPSHKLLLQNQGRIYSKGAVSFAKTARPLGKEGKGLPSNQGGVIESDEKISFEGEESFPKDIGGALLAPKIQFVSPTVLSGERTSYNFADLVADTVFTTDHLLFDFPELNIALRKKDLTLPFGFEARVKRWVNKKRLKVLSGQIHISSATDILNWFDYSAEEGEEDTYLFTYDKSIGKESNIRRLIDKFHFSSTHRPSEAFFEAPEGIVLEAEGKIRNYGGLTSGGDITLRAPFIQHGWAQKDDQVEQLEDGGVRREVFDWHHHYFKPQNVYMETVGAIRIDSPGGRFLNTFGRIRAGQGLDALTRLFLNFAGDIIIDHQPDDLGIESEFFLNTLGMIETSIIPRRYWSINFANTGPAFLNVLEGSLKIKAPYVRNSASFLHGQAGVYLNGTRVDRAIGSAAAASAAGDSLDVRSMIINEHGHLEQTRTVTIEGTDVKVTKHNTCGVGHKSKEITHWRHHYPETKSREALIGAISSGAGVEIEGFDRAEQGAILHGSWAHLKAGEGGIQHGYQKNTKLSAPRKLPSQLDILLGFEEEIERGIFSPTSSGEFAYLPLAAEPQGSPLYVTLLARGDLPDLKTIRFAVSPHTIEQKYITALQKSLGTGRLPSMENLLQSTQGAYDKATSGLKLPLTELPFLEESAVPGSEVRVISPEQVQAGLYFEIRRFNDQNLAFPVLYLDPSLLHETINRVDGTTLADGVPAAGEADSKAGTLVMHSEGSMTLTGAVHGETSVDIKGDQDVEGRTRTRTERVSERHQTGNVKGGKWSQRTTRGTETSFKDILESEIPTYIGTGPMGWLRVRAGKEKLLTLLGIDTKAGTGGIRLTAEDGTIRANALETSEHYDLPDGSGSSSTRATYVPTTMETTGSINISAALVEADVVQMTATNDIDINAKRLRMAALESRWLAKETLEVLNWTLDTGIRISKTFRSSRSEPRVTSREGSLHFSAAAAASAAGTGLSELDGRYSAPKGGIEISGGRGVVLTAVETESETGTRIQAPVIYDLARHDVESRDTSFTRIGVKGLLRAGEQETWGRAVRSHHVSRAAVDIGDETSQEVHLQAPHIEAGSFIATVNKETGTLEITDAQNYYMRQAASKHRNLSSITDILTPITMDWGTIARTQESSSHTTSVGAIIDTEEGSHLSGATIDLTNVAYEDIDGLGRHIIDGKKFIYRVGRETRNASYSYSSPGVWWQDFEQESMNYSRPLDPVLKGIIDVYADEVSLEYAMDNISALDPFQIHRGRVTRTNVPLIYDCRQESHSAPGVATQALITIAIGCATGGVGAGTTNAFLAGAMQGATAAALSHVTICALSGEDPFTQEGLKKVIIAAITQGLTKGTIKAVYGVEKAVTFAEHAGRAALNVGISTGVNWAVEGGKGSDILPRAGLSFIGETLDSYGSMRLGSTYGNPDIDIDYWGHKIGHGILGAATGALASPDDPVIGGLSSMIGHVVGEIAMEAYAGHPEERYKRIVVNGDPSKTYDQRMATYHDIGWQHAASRATAVVAAAMLRGDPHLADTTADRAIQNNYRYMLGLAAGGGAVAATATGVAATPLIIIVGGGVLLGIGAYGLYKLSQGDPYSTDRLINSSSASSRLEKPLTTFSTLSPMEQLSKLNYYKSLLRGYTVPRMSNLHGFFRRPGFAGSLMRDAPGPMPQLPGFEPVDSGLRGPIVETFPIIDRDISQSVFWTPVPGRRHIEDNILWTPIPGYDILGGLGTAAGPQILYTPIPERPTMSILMRDGERSGKFDPKKYEPPKGVDPKKPSSNPKVGYYIALKRFTKRLGNGKWRDPKSNYDISRENALNSGSGSHGGGTWKLIYKLTDRKIAILDEYGKVIRVYK